MGHPHQFSNNATSTLASPITNSALSLSLTSGGGSKFPSPSGGQDFIATLTKSGSPGTQEVVLVTGRSGDTMTIPSGGRGYDGTTALAWSAGDIFSLNPEGRALNDMVQFNDLYQQANNFAFDSGSANSIVCNWPAITAVGRIIGMPLTFIANATNIGSGAAINDGVGTVNLQAMPGQNLGPGMIRQGKIYTVSWDGTEYQIINNPWQITVPVSLAVSGVNSALNLNCVARITNDLVLMSLGTSSPTVAASNADYLYVSNVPAALIPASEALIPTCAIDNGNLVSALAQFTSGGIINFYRATAVLSGANAGQVQFSGTGWTASGSKGFPSSLLLAYSLI